MSRNHETIYPGLSVLQADGVACLACDRNYLRSRAAHVPIGRSETGSQVFVCLGDCLARVVETACECNGGPACACPDCDCLDCSYRPVMRASVDEEDTTDEH